MGDGVSGIIGIALTRRITMILVHRWDPYDLLADLYMLYIDSYDNPVYYFQKLPYRTYSMSARMVIDSFHIVSQSCLALSLSPVCLYAIHRNALCIAAYTVSAYSNPLDARRSIPFENI